MAPRGARWTARLEDIVHHLGIALGGRPAATLARRLMLPVSRDMLLRVSRRVAQAPGGPVRVIAIDDFAWKPGQRYGTVVMTARRDDLSEADAVMVAAIETGVATLAAARDLMERFYRMFRVRDTDALATWVTDTSASLLASFGKGSVADPAVVRAALTEPWSTGQTEVQITKLKLVQMYGRARLDLLRASLVVPA